MSGTLLKMLAILHKIMACTMHYVSCNTLNVCQGLKGGLEEPPRAQGNPPTPILHSHKFPMVASHKTPVLNLMALVSFWLNLGFFFNYP